MLALGFNLRPAHTAHTSSSGAMPMIKPLETAGQCVSGLVCHMGRYEQTQNSHRKKAEQPCDQGKRKAKAWLLRVLSSAGVSAKNNMVIKQAGRARPNSEV